MQSSIASEVGTYTNDMLNLSAMLIFMLMLISISVLACTGSMLYFKVVSDMQENEKNYKLLYCIGANKKELRKIIRKQASTMFMIPFLAGVAHTVMFTIYTIYKHLAVGISSVGVSVVLYVAIYMIYFLIAVLQGNGLIKRVHLQKRE